MIDDPKEAPVPSSAPPPVERTLDQRMARGAVWMVAARAADRLLALASTMILARLLLPVDFGLVAMATAVTAILELFAEFGFDVALIQNSNAERRHYDTAWTLNVISGAVLALALLGTAGPASRFYAEPRLEVIIMWLALGSLIQGFDNIGIVAFRKELNFRREFKYLFFRRLISFLVTIPLAIATRSYWALIIGILAGRAWGVLLSYIMQEYRPRFSLAGRGDLFHFSKWIVVTGLLSFLNNRSADFLIGKFSGARELGLFNLAYELANVPSSALIAPVNRAIFPGYAKKAHSLPVLRKSYLEVLSFIAILAIPAGVGLAATASLVVPVVLGQKWIEATPTLIILSLYGILLAVKSNNHYVYLAFGKPRIATLLGAAQTILVLPLIAWGSIRAGAFGAAVGYVGGQLIFSPISMAVIRRVLGLRFSDWIAVFWRPTLACAVMFGCVRLIAAQVDPAGADVGALVAALLGCVLAGAVAYSVTLYGLWVLSSRPIGPESAVFDILRARIRIWRQSSVDDPP